MATVVPTDYLALALTNSTMHKVVIDLRGPRNASGPRRLPI